MKEIVFTIGEFEYRTINKRLNARQQFRLFKIVSPMLASGIVEILTLFGSIKRDGLAAVLGDSVELAGLKVLRKLQDVPLERWAVMAPTVARELKNMTAEETEVIFELCLSLLVRRPVSSDQRYLEIWSQQARRSPWDDIEFDFLLTMQIIYQVLVGTFGGFMPASPSELIGGGAQASTSSASDSPMEKTG